MIRRLRNQLGFSLLEVLMAMGVFAMTASTILPSVAQQMQISRDDEMLSQGLFAAKDKMTEIENKIQEDTEKGKFPDKDEQSGKFEGVYEGYSWEYSIRKVEIPMPDSGAAGSNPMVGNMMKSVLKDISKAVREVKLTVSWWDDEDSEKDRAKKEITLTTHVVNTNLK